MPVPLSRHTALQPEWVAKRERMQSITTHKEEEKEKEQPVAVAPATADANPDVQPSDVVPAVPVISPLAEEEAAGQRDGKRGSNAKEKKDSKDGKDKESKAKDKTPKKLSAPSPATSPALEPRTSGEPQADEPEDYPVPDAAAVPKKGGCCTIL